MAENLMLPYEKAVLVYEDGKWHGIDYTHKPEGEEITPDLPPPTGLGAEFCHLVRLVLQIGKSRDDSWMKR